MLDVLEVLRRKCEGRTQNAVAAELGVSPAYLSDVLNQRKEPGEGILEPLGIERVVTYRRKRPNGQPHTAQ
jgi:transcriptional regulator with XRE-family HTH domain